MPKVKTAELKGRALDWAVAQCEGESTFVLSQMETCPMSYPFRPSTAYGYGMNIVEREGIATRKHRKSGTWYAIARDDIGDLTSPSWRTHTYRGAQNSGLPRQQTFTGETLLIAAMRCYVASKTGGEIFIPAKILKD